MTTVGYGQFFPDDANTDFNVTAFIVRQMIARLDTMKLVQVQVVHGGGGAIAAAGTVDVLPLVNQVDGSGNPQAHGTVYGIPWWRLQGGNGAVIADPVANDVGYIIVSDRDISNAKANPGQQVNPPSFRRYNLQDGIYVGGCLNGIPTQYIAFTPQGIVVHDLNGNVLNLSSSGITMTPNGGIVTVNGTKRATGAVFAGFGTPDQVGLQTHLTSAFGAPPTPGT